MSCLQHRSIRVIMQLIVLVAMMAAMVFASTRAATAAPANNNVVDYKASLLEYTVHIEGDIAETVDGATNRFRAKADKPCTAWFIAADGRFATAASCSEDAATGKQLLMQQASGSNVRVGNLSFVTHVRQNQTVPGSCAPSWTPAHKLAQMAPQNGDIALYQVAVHNGCQTQPLHLANSRVMDGQAVRVVGFPTGIRTAVRSANGGVYGSSNNPYQPAVSNGTTVASASYPHGSLSMAMINVPFKDGAAGSPVLDNANHVVGMLTQQDNPGDDFSFATSRDDLSLFFGVNGIAGSTLNSANLAANTSSNGIADSSNWTVAMFAFFAIIGLAFLGALVYFAYCIYRDATWPAYLYYPQPGLWYCNAPCGHTHHGHEVNANPTATPAPATNGVRQDVNAARARRT